MNFLLTKIFEDVFITWPIGPSSILLSCDAISKSVLQVGSPALSVGVVVEGSKVRKVIMAVAACSK